MAARLTYPQSPTEESLSRCSPVAALDFGFGGSAGIVYVTAGKSAEKTVALLRWTFSMFPGQEICLVHVHRPSPFIPTLLGKLPAARANPETVAAFRIEERAETMKLLSTYLLTCSRSRVKASTITTEADEVQKGIINLVNLHTIRKLVIGPTKDFMKGKKSSCKGGRVSEDSPPYCEMWFVKKGKLIWTRRASASSSICHSICQLATSRAHNSISRSLNSLHNESEASQIDTSLSTISHRVTSSCDPYCARSSSSGKTGEEKTEDEYLHIQFAELNGEVDESNDEVYLKLHDLKHFEAEALEALSKIKAFGSTHSHEVKLRIEAENELRVTIQEQEKLFEEREKITKQLQKTMQSIAVLDSRAQEANHKCEEVAGELKLIQASMAALRKEKQKLQSQKVEATRWLDSWRSHEQCEDATENKFLGLMGDVSKFPEFLLSDLEAATCNFSESFRIGYGGYGTVYKGELLNRTVAIKKLNSYDIQRQSEFHRELLGKLHHPHLVELIGVCPESWSLVYEYLPGGSLQKHISNSNGTNAFHWKIRAQIVAGIASGLLFLHSLTPKKIVHGNLKPENLLLDMENRCKISDYAVHTLTSGPPIRWPSFRGCSQSTGACLYTDPETYRTGKLTHKSDIYSFGVIILQLVTGKTDGNIIGEVRRAFSSGKVGSVLDLSGGDWPTYVGRRLVELGLQYCESNGKDRPDLTPTLVKEMECMSFLEEQMAPSFFLCPIFREIMHDPQVAADGFTYEDEAIRGWLGSERDTSPMTNLKLSDLNLTPNHSLRLAIQDWIANLEIAS